MTQRMELRVKNAIAIKQQSSATSAHIVIIMTHPKRKMECRRIPNSGLKLPFFDESRDDIDNYLRSFERYAEVQGGRHLIGHYISVHC